MRPGTQRSKTGPGDYSFLQTVTEAEWGYFAGILVGEGHLGISGEPTAPQFRLAVKIGDEEVCEHLADKFGGAVTAGERGGITYHREDGRRRTFTDMYVWTVSDGYLIKELIKRAMPYLQGNKKEQAVHYLAFVTEKLICWERKTTEGRAVYTPAEQLMLLHLAYECRKCSLGGRKAWKKTWSDHMDKLVAEAGQGNVRTSN